MGFDERLAISVSRRPSLMDSRYMQITLVSDLHEVLQHIVLSVSSLLPMAANLLNPICSQSNMLRKQGPLRRSEQ